MRRKNKGPLTSERGVALLLVLWVIVFLAFVCAEFSWTMRTEMASAINFKEGTQALYAAEAGINRSIIELLRVSAESRGGSRSEFSLDDFDELDEPDDRDDRGDTDELSDEDMDGLYDEQQLWLAGGGPYRFQLGDFYCEVSIIDESNKININEFLNQSAQDPTKLKNFLGEQIGLEGDELDIVADSLIDWWDKDNYVTGVFGTEDEYYESLDPPYRSRNADMQVIEECLLVRGVTEEIFYGRGRQMETRVQLIPEELEQLLSGKELSSFFADEDEDFDETEIIPLRLGLTDVFSVTSNASSFKININTASFEQLMLLQGMQQQSAQEILAERTERLFYSPTDRLPQFANYEVWKDTIKVAPPDDLNNYSVYARGFSRDGRVSRSIMCSLLVSSDQCIISDWRIDG
jgi:type II secretory pathway component PulK